ncbi:unnamed protein product [Timema podura]|uniref:Uncharacterized protein n=1 Tax=Timema podura TaxID=61482 RepID=A0ABN7NEN6_TIMPD|nr:unnamed protein product [Timema podura]
MNIRYCFQFTMITSTFLLVLVVATAIPGVLLVVMPIQQMYYSVPPFYEGDKVYQTVPQGTWNDAILEKHPHESLKVVSTPLPLLIIKLLSCAPVVVWSVRLENRNSPFVQTVGRLCEVFVGIVRRPNTPGSVVRASRWTPPTPRGAAPWCLHMVSAQGAGTVWRSGDRQAQVDLNGHASRVYGGPGGNSPPTFGGGASYNHNNRGGVGVDVSRTPGFGTQTNHTWELIYIPHMFVYTCPMSVMSDENISQVQFRQTLLTLATLYDNTLC